VSGELRALLWSGKNSGVDMTCWGRMVILGIRFARYIYRASAPMLLECM